MSEYQKYCMNQILFWERMLEQSQSSRDQDDIIIHIDDVLRTRSVPKLKELYKYLDELELQGQIDESQHRKYLKYISTAKVA